MAFITHNDPGLLSLSLIIEVYLTEIFFYSIRGLMMAALYPFTRLLPCLPSSDPRGMALSWFLVSSPDSFMMSTGWSLNLTFIPKIDSSRAFFWFFCLLGTNPG